MIVYDLKCEQGHRFEGWFGSSADYAEQQERGLVSCPRCGSSAVEKAPMAPAVPAKSAEKREDRQMVQKGELSPEVTRALSELAKAQASALKKSTWVGDKFAEESRAIHYGERDEKPIYGRASAREAQDLVDEGISIAPLPFPVSPPDEIN